MAGQIESVIDAFHEQIATFHPQRREEVHGFFQGLPRLYEELAKAIKAAADNMSDEHIHSAVIDVTNEVASVTASVGHTAEEAYTTHLAKHNVWLDD